MTFIAKHTPNSYENLKNIITEEHFDEFREQCTNVGREINLNITLDKNDFSFPIIVYEYHNKYSIYIKGLIPDSYLFYF